jgi:hypothetical protein
MVLRTAQENLNDEFSSRGFSLMTLRRQKMLGETLNGLTPDGLQAAIQNFSHRKEEVEQEYLDLQYKLKIARRFLELHHGSKAMSEVLKMEGGRRMEKEFLKRRYEEFKKQNEVIEKEAEEQKKKQKKPE